MAGWEDYVGEILDDLRAENPKPTPKAVRDAVRGEIWRRANFKDDQTEVLVMEPLNWWLNQEFPDGKKIIWPRRRIPEPPKGQ